MFRLTALIALLGSTTALKTHSTAGKKVLSKSRSLEQNQNYAWIMDYSMVFQSCHKVVEYTDEDNEQGTSLSSRHLVKYKLCPSNSCGYGCEGAEYVTDMETFVDAWTEWTMNDQEYQCEQIRENCQCQYYYGDEQVCENNCYKSAGMSECIENNGDDDAYEFELQEWLECKESEAMDGYGNNLYVGPKCSESGEQINMGVFRDQYCTEEYSSEVFAMYYGGTQLPYQNENIVAENCINCKEIQQNNGYYEGADITEICEELYPLSAKCERDLQGTINYPITSACEYIDNIKMHEVGYEPVSHFASTAFAVVFGVSTVLLAGVSAHLYRLNNRKIQLHTDAAVV